MTGSVGLGLAIARMLTDEMEGELTYERVDGETHFVLSLLRATEGLAPRPEFVQAARPLVASRPDRFGGVAASFAGNGEKERGNERGAEGSDALAAGDPWSGR